MQSTLSAKYIVNTNLSLYNRKHLSRYGNIEAYRLRSTEISRQRGVTAINRNAVTQAFWRDFAVCTYREPQTQDFTELDDLLRQKPTSIERGVPVGTKGLDRGAELSEFCVGSEPVRAIQGAIRV
jgi:hypothetical protein